MRLSRNKLATAGAGLALIAFSAGLVVASPTLYRAFCAATGYGGTIQRGTESAMEQEPPSTAADAAAASETVTVFFDANVGPDLPWTFAPEQRSVTAHFGEPVQAYYDATNRSDRTIVARAAFNVTPYKAAPYFFKLQCFCFTEERLEPGETARMPVVLYVDEQLLDDPSANELRQITLSYTFFEQKGLTPEEVAAARDLAQGSREAEQASGQGAPAEFDNDAPRR